MPDPTSAAPDLGAALNAHIAAIISQALPVLRAQLRDELVAELGERPAPTATVRPVMTPAEAADYCRCSVRYLADLRAAGRGPRFNQPEGPGGPVTYDRDNLDAWRRSRRTRRHDTTLPA